MYGAMVGSVVCEGYAFSSKNDRLLNLRLSEMDSIIEIPLWKGSMRMTSKYL